MDRRRIVSMAALFAWSGATVAQPASGGDVLSSLSRCRALTAPDARLDCFDKATAALENAVRAKDVTILNRQDIRNARRSLFGFTIPRLPLFGGGDHDESSKNQPAFEELNTTITSVRPAANGRVELRLAEGDAVWMTTDPMPFPPKAGDRIRLRRGAIGNYFLAIDGQRSVRGMRVR